MNDLTTRIQGIEDEIAALRRALHRLREICAEADRLRRVCAAPEEAAAARANIPLRRWQRDQPAPALHVLRPAPDALPMPDPGSRSSAASGPPLLATVNLREAEPWPPAPLGERIDQVLYSDNFIFHSGAAQTARKG